jgi:hypothetical protein
MTPRIYTLEIAEDRPRSIKLAQEALDIMYTMVQYWRDITIKFNSGKYPAGFFGDLPATQARRTEAPEGLDDDSEDEDEGEDDDDEESQEKAAMCQKSVQLCITGEIFLPQ